MASKRQSPSAPGVLHAPKPTDEKRTVAGAPEPPQYHNEGGRNQKSAAGNGNRDVVLDFPEALGPSRAELDTLERYLGAEIDRILDTRGEN